MNAAPGAWRLSVGPAIVDRGQRRKTLMNRARFWIRHALRRRVQVYHQATGECWEWRGSTWIKVTEANAGAVVKQKSDPPDGGRLLPQHGSGP